METPIIMLSDPTAEQYNEIKNRFGELLDEYHFLRDNKITDPKNLYFMEDINICRFNMITVEDRGGDLNPDCIFKNVDFDTFISIASGQFKVFTPEQEKAWREDVTNEIAMKLLTK